MTNPSEIPGIVELVVLAGSQTALANVIGVTPQAVHNWVKDGFVPAARCHQLSAIYGIPTNRLINPLLCGLATPKQKGARFIKND